MLWQIYALVALLAVAAEGAVDKYALSNVKLDLSVASFIRIAVYCCLVIPLSSVAGVPFYWHFSWGILFFGVTGAGMALAYSVVLKNVKFSSISVLLFLLPLLYLVIDSWVDHPLTPYQKAGVVGLSLSGVLFIYEKGLTFNRQVFLAFLVMAAYAGAEMYYLKHLNKVEGVPGPVFFANTWIWAALFSGLYLLWKRPAVESASVWRYLKMSLFSKTFDAISSIAAGIGLTLTTVALYSSFQVFTPVIGFATALFTQYVLKKEMGEALTRGILARKGVAIAGILFCANLVSG